MNGFVTLLKEYQEKLHSEAELIQQQIANSNEISERQANYLDKLVESESRVADLADNVKKEADAAQQAVDMLSDHCKDQISGIVDAAKQDMDALAASTKVLTEASHSQMETLAQTAESEMQLLSNTAAQLSEENHKQLMELTKASSEQMSVISEAANNVMQNSKQQIEEAIKATQAQSDALMQATNDFSDFVQQEHKNWWKLWIKRCLVCPILQVRLQAKFSLRPLAWRTRQSCWIRIWMMYLIAPLRRSTAA